VLSALASSSALAQWASTTTFTFDGESLPTGLVISTDLIKDLASDGSTARFNHQFNEANVQVADGFLQLTVPGGQTTSPIQCGEVSTNFEVKYASVSTFAILTEEPGICNGKRPKLSGFRYDLRADTVTGMFFYQSDSQEIDIEWISDPSSTSNQNTNNGTRVMQYTNQGPHGTEDSIEINGRAPDDATSEVHEYRIDWTPESSSFYLDGVFQQQIDGNVPTVGGAWTWNAWT
jgi:beta-glucanase (GH16 family)